LALVMNEKPSLHSHHRQTEKPQKQDEAEYLFFLGSQGKAHDTSRKGGHYIENKPKGVILEAE